MASDPLPARFEETLGAEVKAALTRAKAARAEPYYDEAADQSARASYYAEVTAAEGESLRAALAELLERTHAPRPSYKPSLMVYPRVDLHPDGLLRSIYSGKTFEPHRS